MIHPQAVVPSFSATAGLNLSPTSRSSSRRVSMSGLSVVSSVSLTSMQKFDLSSLSVSDSPLAVLSLVLLFGTEISLCPFSSEVSQSDKHPRIDQMSLRECDSVLLVLLVSHTSEANEGKAT